MTTTVIHVRDMRPDDIYIGRGMPRQRLAVSPWANPYRITPTQPRERVIRRYRWLLTTERPDLMARLPELRGKRLACWCAPHGVTLTADDPLVCHGQVLAALANEVTAASICRPLNDDAGVWVWPDGSPREPEEDSGL